MKSLKYIAFSIIGMISLHASAATLVEDAWVRATVPGQPSTGAFMRITSTEGGKLLEATSPVAKLVQIHESKMHNDIMSMHAVDAVELPAGQAVDIDPEGYHIMLMNLVGQVKEGDSVPLTLVIENAKGVKESVEVKATARALTEMPMHDHGKMMH